MKKVTATVALLLTLSFTLVSISETGTVKAEPKTIVVPDDFLSVFDAVEATSEGDTIFVKKGTYEGPIKETLIINRTISIIGEERNSTILNLYPPLVNVTIFTQTFQMHDRSIIVESNNFMLSEITINTPGGGISLTGDRIQINDCNITTGLSLNGSYSTIEETIFKGSLGLNGSNQTITQNTIKGRIDSTGSNNAITDNKISNGGIHSSGSHSFIVGNRLTDLSAGDSGITINGSFNEVIRNNVSSESPDHHPESISVDGNSNIVSENILYHGGIGIQLKKGSSNIVFGNNITGHWFMGIHLHDAIDSLVYENYIADNVWEYDGYGISLSGLGCHAENNTIYRNIFINNSYNFRVESPYLNYWDNGKEGNYWDDYSGQDNNGDGIGDTPYIINENNQDNYPLTEPITIPEFPSWLILPLFLMAVLFAVILKKRIRYLSAT
jgi:parallel beta-helix repeat protein